MKTYFYETGSGLMIGLNLPILRPMLPHNLGSFAKSMKRFRKRDSPIIFASLSEKVRMILGGLEDIE
jgi:hypothetical protein